MCVYTHIQGCVCLSEADGSVSCSTCAAAAALARTFQSATRSVGERARACVREHVSSRAFTANGAAFEGGFASFAPFLGKSHITVCLDSFIHFCVSVYVCVCECACV